MEKLEELMLWAFGLLAWMSVALSSFHTQDQQLGGKGGFDTESCRHMIFFGWASTAAFALAAYHFTKNKWFVWLAVITGIGGALWTYVVPHPILGGET